MRALVKIGCSAILGMALVSSVFAGDKDPTDQVAVWVTGTYTEPSNNGLSYGDFFQSSPTIEGFDGERRAVFIDQDSEFDYALGMSYHFCGTDTRLFVTFDHFGDSDSSSNGNIRDIVIAPIRPTSGFAQVATRADELRIGLSHVLKFSPQFRTNLTAFFEWDDVKQETNENISTSVSQEIGTLQFNASRNTFNKARGWGPGVGLTVYAVPFSCYPQFGFFMGGKTSLLLMDNDFNETANINDQNIYDYNPESTESLVTKIDLSLGLSYGQRIQCFCDMLLDVNLGLRYMNMFNVFKNGNAYANPVYPGSNGVDFASNLGYATDWGRMGPFLTFALGGVNS